MNNIKEKILLTVFDGLDYQLIKYFQLENIRQKEFGIVDNQTGMKNIYTEEIHASLITGQTPEKHGVIKKNTWTNPTIQKIENKLDGKHLFDKFEGLRESIYESLNFLNAKHRKYRKEDLEIDTLFEKIESSRAMFVPSYNPSPFYMTGAGSKVLQYGYSSKEAEKNWRKREWKTRIKDLFKELESEILYPRPFLMCHFHFPDFIQHLYGDRSTENFDKAKLREVYLEVDELAGEIKEKALESGYDRIIFMSDHGVPLPYSKDHNKNAFYSCNQHLFHQRKPKITDFHDRILGLVN